MTALPAVADATGATRNEGQFKAYMTSEHDYLAGLFGTDGVPATALATLGALGATYAAKTGAYTVVTGDRGKVIACTNSWTLGLPAVATAGAGFSAIIANTGSGTITIDPSGAETVDGAATFALGPLRMVLIICTGSAWLTLALAGSVTTSSTDTTAGRLMKTGDFGLGSMAAIDVADYNAITATGIYRNASVATGSPIASSLYWSVLHLAHSSDGTSSQFAMRSAGVTINEMYFRRKAGGVWSAWDKVFHSGNLLGTVSQTGGAPTGAVIERGSNANGEYVRFADGTQICTKAISGLGPISTASGALFVATGTTIGTLPATFAAIPARTLDVSQSAGVTAWVQGATAPSVSSGGVVQLVKATTAANTDFTITATFIGRWF